jgi:hypothetical protein
MTLSRENVNRVAFTHAQRERAHSSGPLPTHFEMREFRSVCRAGNCNQLTTQSTDRVFFTKSSQHLVDALVPKGEKPLYVRARQVVKGMEPRKEVCKVKKR